MPTIQSTRHRQLIINGHRFSGFADEDPPWEYEPIEVNETTTGRDGTLNAVDKGMLGTILTIKLLDTSESTKQVLRWLAERARGARTIFEGTDGDPTLGYSTALNGGVLLEAKPAVEQGETYEVKFQFEETIPDYDGAQFAPAPSPVV